MTFQLAVGPGIFRRIIFKIDPLGHKKWVRVFKKSGPVLLRVNSSIVLVLHERYTAWRTNCHHQTGNITFWGNLHSYFKTILFFNITFFSIHQKNIPGKIFASQSEAKTWHRRRLSTRQKRHRIFLAPAAKATGNTPHCRKATDGLCHAAETFFVFLEATCDVTPPNRGKETVVAVAAGWADKILLFST